MENKIESGEHQFSDWDNYDSVLLCMVDNVYYIYGVYVLDNYEVRYCAGTVWDGSILKSVDTSHGWAAE